MRQFANRTGPAAPTNDAVRAARAPVPAPAAFVPAGGDLDISGVPLRLQTKLVVGDSQDPLEREADRVADAALGLPDGAPPIAASSSGSTTASETLAPNIVHKALASPGRPLDTAKRAFFEPRFERDFSEVRVHSGATAAASAAAIGARAYAVGSDIVFGAAQEERNLLAHELAHVAQQNAGPTRVLRRQMHETLDGDDDPIRKALLGKQKEKKDVPKDLSALKRDFVGLQLPPEHEVTAVPHATEEKQTAFEMPKLGNYELGADKLPKIPQDFEELEESREQSESKIEQKISILGSYDSATGEIGFGAQIKTPLSPILKWIAAKLRAFLEHLRRLRHPRGEGTSPRSAAARGNADAATKLPGPQEPHAAPGNDPIGNALQMPKDIKKAVLDMKPQEVTGMPRAADEKKPKGAFQKISSWYSNLLFGVDELPKAPTNQEDFEKTLAPSEKDLVTKPKYNILLGLFGAGVGVKAPLTPILKWAGRKLRALRQMLKRRKAPP